jgi:LmbE family N-acetylglucosaminyl deacetylase
MDDNIPKFIPIIAQENIGDLPKIGGKVAATPKRLLSILKYITLLPIRAIRRAFRCVRRCIVRRKLRNLLVYAPRLEVRNASALVIAPHPDDEVLGVGGAIALKRDAHVNVDIIYITCGESSHKQCCNVSPQMVAAQRQDLAVAAGRVIGIQTDCIHWIGLPCSKIPSRGQNGFDEAVSKVASIIKTVHPKEVYYPYRWDCWKDHEATAEISEAAVIQSGIDCEQLYYFIWAWYKLPLIRAYKLCREEFRAVDIRAVLSKKLEAIEAYLNRHPPMCDKPYVGQLPRGFLSPFRLPYELLINGPGKNGPPNE